MTDQNILDNAPEGATHVDNDGDYFKYSFRNFKYSFQSWTYYDEQDNGWFVSDSKSLRSLADIKRIAELEDQWISVEDSLPNELQEVLSFDEVNGIVHSIYRSKCFKKVNLVWEHTNVTHWMPLPEPPKEQEDEKK